MSFSAMLKNARISAGMTQSELASKAGFNRVRISEWERGKTDGIEARSIFRLEQALNLTLGALYTEKFQNSDTTGGKS